jgi:DNA-binding Lrp family transcriptional regulator
MTESSSVPAAEAPAPPQDVRRPVLDAVDRRILRLLRADGRMANSALAAAVGIAPSTCLARVRALRDSGVIRGFHAEIDPVAVGRGLRAMIAVRMAPGSRHGLTGFARDLAARPEVLDVYFLAGADDYLLHVAVRDTAALRRFVVEQLSERPEVAGTETSLIFDHLRGVEEPG